MISAIRPVLQLPRIASAPVAAAPAPSPAPPAPCDGFVSCTAEAADARGTLARTIEGVINGDDGLRSAQWGLVVYDDKGQVLYQKDADRLFTPASNLKLLTAAAALSVLGPDARFTTRLATSGNIDADGVLHGNLYLVGGGDPSLRSADLQAAVQALPMRKIDGSIVIDDDVFDGTRLGHGWAWDNLSDDYSAEVDGLTLDENVAAVKVTSRGASAEPDTGYLMIRDHAAAGSSTDVRVSRELGTNVVNVEGTIAAGDTARASVTVHDPALYAGAVLASLCRARGIEVSGDCHRGHAPADARAVWEKSSDRLIALERHMLKESDNLYAETLFRALNGGQSHQAPEKEKRVLGIDQPCTVVDGSGLSRYDAVSPSLLGKLVQTRYRDAAARDCLPVAGVDGTLKHRMASLKGRVQAKTGTLDATSTLCGWLTLQDGRQVSFAWMCNNYPGSTSTVKQTEDRLLEAIDGAL